MVKKGKECIGAKVLVADDDRQMRDLLIEFLTRQRYEVVLASNREEATGLADREYPDVILLDVRIPGIDGIEVYWLPLLGINMLIYHNLNLIDGVLSTMRLSCVQCSKILPYV